jgi:hypothetical protein
MAEAAVILRTFKVGKRTIELDKDNKPFKL